MILQGEHEKRNHIYYELDRTRPPLGRGGTGVVYKGEQIDEVTGATRPVAIKEIYQNSQTQEIVKRARWEASIQVRNENLIEMLGFIETTESKMNIVTTRYYVISEYLAGITLDKVLEGVTVDQQGEKMPAAEQLYIAYQQDKNQTACNMVKQILNGLTILHDRGIIHRDIDPSNIMVTQEGHLKLIDFGISKKLQQASESVAGTFVAKPYYAAPEQIRGDSSKQCPATDIYQMGVLFYQLLTGELPFIGSDHEILDGHLKRKPNLQAVNNPTYREVIRKAMEKNPQKRYLSTSAMRVALDTPHSSHTTAVLASLAAVLVMVVAVVTLNSRKPEEPVNPINIEEQDTSKKVAKNDPKEKETLKELEETETLDVPIEPDTINPVPVKTLSRDEEDIWEFLSSYDGDEKMGEWKYKQKALDLLKSDIDNPYALLYFAAWVIKTNHQNQEEEKSRKEIYNKLKNTMRVENYVKKEDGKAKINNWDYSRLKCGVLAIIRANEKATDKDVKDCANRLFINLDKKASAYFILNK